MWPPAGETQRWYLGRWGTLATEPPAESAPDRYHYNPHDPTPAVGGPALNMGTAGRKDQRRREHRHDVLTYTSPVLREDLTVIGPLTATLYVRSSLEHTDFFVRLCDVNEKGRSVNLSDGIVRLAPGSVARTTTASFRLEIDDVADGQHVPGRPPHPPPGLERRPPAVLPQRGDGRAAGDGRQPALGGPGGVARRGAPVGHRAAGGAAAARRGHSTGAPRAARTRSASLPRMTQPTFVPIAEADQVRPALHLDVPGAWTTSRPAELVVPEVRRGRDIGTPGPDSGFALRLAKRFEHELEARRRASRRTTSSSGVALVGVQAGRPLRPCAVHLRRALRAEPVGLPRRRRAGRPAGRASGRCSPPSPTTTWPSGRWSTPSPRRPSGSAPTRRRGQGGAAAA